MAKKNKVKFTVIGTTLEGKRVISGVFRVFDTCGLPLDVVFDLCDRDNLIPSWTHFYDDAINQGWSDKTILNRLSSSIPDSYGYSFWLEVEMRLNLYIDSKD